MHEQEIEEAGNGEESVENDSKVKILNGEVKKLLKCLHETR